MRQPACLLLALLLGAQAATPTGRRQLQGQDVVSGAISGGQTAQRNRYRWNASLRQGEGVLRGDPFCSAALIEMRVLVTTASCVLGPDLGQPPLPVNAFRFPQVRLDAFERRGGEYEIRKVTTVLAPSAWRRGSHEDDIALLLLDRPSRMPPISLPAAGGPNPAAPVFTSLTALGFGQWDTPPTEPDVPRYLQEASPLLLSSVLFYSLLLVGHKEAPDTEPNVPRYLHEVQLPLQRQAQCEYFYPKFNVWRNKKCICAGQNRARAGLCKGDYGGPLFLPGRNATTDLLVGISAFKGDPGCKGGKPSGFTNVASYAAWIQGGFDIFFKGANVTSQYRLYKDPGPDTSIP
ncbi:hypothetical protein ABPG75_006652 [Micractinium tetrahymenae]